MKNINKFLACLGLTAVCFMAASSPVYAAVAGHVQFVSGNVQVTSVAGQVRQAQKGGPINEGDMVSSAQQSSVQIKMQDGGFIAVRPNTKLKIEQFRFSGQADGGNDRSFFSLIKGGFRSITGLIGQVNKQNYRVTTPAATIGIRGTDYEAVYTEAAPVNLAAADMLMAVTDVPAPIMAGGFAAAIVNKGAIEMGTNKGTTLLQPGQGMVVSYGMNQLPVIKPLDVNLFPGAGKDKPSGQGGGKGGNGDKEGNGNNDGGDQNAGGDNNEGESNNTADNGQGATGDNSTADGGAGAANEPVRDTSVVDAAPPATGGVPAALTPTVNSAMTTTMPNVPVVQPVVVVVGGQAINLTGGGALTAPVVSPVAPAGAVAPYTQTDKAFAFVTSSQNYQVPFAEIGTIAGKPADMNNALPNPSFIDRNAGKDAASYIAYTLSGTTTVGAAATTITPTGISFGRYDSAQATKQVVGTTTAGAAGSTTTPNGVFMHWISGPAIDPVYLPEVLLGTSTYTFDGGTVPTNPFGGGATLDSATLSVNFTQQLVSFNLGLTVGGSPWTASTAGTPLTTLNGGNAKTGFMATTVARPGWGGLTVTGATYGDVAGQLTGNGLNGALLSYYLVNGGNQVSGVAAFSGAAQNTATSYRLVALSASTANTNANWFPVGVAAYPVPIIHGGYNNATSVTADAAGLLQFNSSGMQNNTAFTVSRGAATATGLGTDPVSGISWGRWDGASFTTTDLATAAVSNANNIGSAHWIASPVLSGPVTLPVTGTFNYVRAGWTAPTDYVVGAGTVGVGTLNTATLSANFSTQTVNIGLNVTTPNAGTLDAIATNIPIQQGSMFNAATAGAINGNNNGALTLTCGAGCTGTPQGEIGGAFAGPGGIGAAMLYGFSAGASNNILVNGAVAFHR